MRAGRPRTPTRTGSTVAWKRRITTTTNCSPTRNPRSFRSGPTSGEMVTARLKVRFGVISGPAVDNNDRACPAGEKVRVIVSLERETSPAESRLTSRLLRGSKRRAKACSVTKATVSQQGAAARLG